MCRWHAVVRCWVGGRGGGGGGGSSDPLEYGPAEAFALCVAIFAENE